MTNPPFRVQYVLLALALTVAVVLAVAAPASQAQAPTNSGNFDLATELVAELNQARAAHTLPAVTTDARLTAAAAAKAETLLTEEWFDHVTKDGRTPWSFVRSAGYNYHVAGENLAMDFASATAITQAWLESPTHRENMLDRKFSNVGIAAIPGRYGDRETMMVVEILAAPDDRTTIERTLDLVSGIDISIQ